MSTRPEATQNIESWNAPRPRELLKVRRELVKYTRSQTALDVRARIVADGAAKVLPWIPNAPLNPITTLSSALALTTLEAERLDEATVFSASREMTDLVRAAAHTPPKEAFRKNRLPAESGLIVFDRPIAAYHANLASMEEFTLARADLKIAVPIVAASWSCWSPRSWSGWDPNRVFVSGDQGINWHDLRNPDRDLVAPDFDGVWITFYSDNTVSPYDWLDPTEPLARRRNGSIVTALDYKLSRSSAHRREPCLMWETDIIVPWGQDLSQSAEAESSYTWLQTLYTAWQLMTQRPGRGSAAITETISLTPRAVDSRRDASEGIRGDSAVRVVRLHTSQRGQSESGSRRSAQPGEHVWHWRWGVRPHKKNLCLNPHLHKTRECEHEEYFYPYHIRGPADAPFKTPTTVHLWDQSPDDDPTDV